MFKRHIRAYPLRWLLPAVLAVILLPTCALPATATAVSSGPVCGGSERAAQESSGGVWTISRPNPFAGMTSKFCLQPNTSGPGFRLLNSVQFNGNVRAYPFTGVGCAYDLCSRNTDLPKRVRALPGNANTSWDWRGTTSGEWNASYDLWFDKRNQITGQDNGAELMIWLRTMPGYPAGTLVHISKHWYRFMHWTTCNDGTCWHYIQFRTQSTVHGVHQLWIGPFIRYAEQRGLISPSWWLTSVHAGYELWSGGRGLSTTWFNVHA